MTPEDRIKKLGSTDDATPTEAEWAAFSTRARRSLARRRVAGGLGAAAVLLAVVVGTYVVTSDAGGDQRGPDVAGSPNRSKAGEPSPTSTPGKTEQVTLQQWFVEDDKLTLAHAQFDKSQTPATEVIMSLLEGVPGPLAEEGVETYIPEGTTLQDLTIANGTAQVTFSGDFPDESDTQQQFAFAQVVYTLTQFRSVDDVSLSWESPESGGVAVAPEDRKRYEHLLPPIVVESPYAGEVVGRRFTLSGIANVYEANVSWRVTNMDGDLLKEGFITATCGSGCWGTFEDRISLEGVLDDVPNGGLILQVFESSAEDGSPTKLVSVPLNFEDRGTAGTNP